MLHGDVLMADLDVDQWRNAQHLLLRSAKGARRIVCLLEKGKVVKCRHTQGAEVAQAPTQVDDLQAGRVLCRVPKRVERGRGPRCLRLPLLELAA